MLQFLSEFEPDLPGWLRPTYRGALFSFGITTGIIGKLFVLLLIATLVYLAGVVQGSLLFAQLFFATVLSGAVGGTVHGLLWRLEDSGRIGIWIRWVFAILAYITTFGFLAPEGPFHPRDYAFFPVALALSAIVAAGLIYADARSPGRLSPRRHREQQGRDRMWAAAHRVRTRRESRLIESSMLAEAGKHATLEHDGSA